MAEDTPNHTGGYYAPTARRSKAYRKATMAREPRKNASVEGLAERYDKIIRSAIEDHSAGLSVPYDELYYMFDVSAPPARKSLRRHSVGGAPGFWKFIVSGKKNNRVYATQNPDGMQYNVHAYNPPYPVFSQQGVAFQGHQPTHRQYNQQDAQVLTQTAYVQNYVYGFHPLAVPHPPTALDVARAAWPGGPSIPAATRHQAWPSGPGGPSIPAATGHQAWPSGPGGPSIPAATGHQAWPSGPGGPSIPAATGHQAWPSGQTPAPSKRTATPKRLPITPPPIPEPVTHTYEAPFLPPNVLHEIFTSLVREAGEEDLKSVVATLAIKNVSKMWRDTVEYVKKDLDTGPSSETEFVGWRYLKLIDVARATCQFMDLVRFFIVNQKDNRARIVLENICVELTFRNKDEKRLSWFMFRPNKIEFEHDSKVEGIGVKGGNRFSQTLEGMKTYEAFEELMKDRGAEAALVECLSFFEFADASLDSLSANLQSRYRPDELLRFKELLEKRDTFGIYLKTVSVGGRRKALVLGRNKLVHAKNGRAYVAIKGGMVPLAPLKPRPK